MEFIWGRNIFQKFLNEPMQRESDLEGSNIFIENSMSPLRADLTSLRQMDVVGRVD